MKTPKTLFDKVWDSHVVKRIADGPDVLFIDFHLVHEVTSPQAFEGLRQRGLPVRFPERTIATMDHNVPTIDQHLPIREAMSAKQVEALRRNCDEFGVTLYGLGHQNQGIVHVIGPELGITQPGRTMVCGDSHTSTHGALGAVAFGIGTSEVEQVLATQCIMQPKPKTFRINIDGRLNTGVTPKDIILHIISKISASGATGYFVEYAGSTIRDMSVEGRLTICNMSIEMGARGGAVSPDQKVFDYLANRPFVPQGANYLIEVEKWKLLATEADAIFEKELYIDASAIEPQITYGTNPGLGIGITQNIPQYNQLADDSQRRELSSALKYMGLAEGQSLLGLPIDYVFIGSCTNARIEDLRAAAQLVKGRRIADGVEVWVVPGSVQVLKQAEAEGLRSVFEEAGIRLREPGCSACLAMNEDKVPEGKYCISTSNRNFEGRQGPGARTFLSSPLTAAAAAITGKVTDPRTLL